MTESCLSQSERSHDEVDNKRRKVRIFPGRCEVSVATVEATRSRDDGELPLSE